MPPSIHADPKVTIVVVNWNKREAVVALMNSLAGMRYDNYSLVIIDNASDDGSVAAIGSHRLPAKVIRNPINLGGTGGFNTGLRYALQESQDYLWLLDNDAEVVPDTLQRLVDAMEGDKRIGIAGSCIVSTENRSLIVEAGSSVDWETGMCRPFLRYENKTRCETMPAFDVDVVPACSALLRDSVIRSVGLMDERYFLHWDDVDYCVTARRAGYRVVAVPTSLAYHSAEKGYSPAVTLYYDCRNTLLFLAKHARGFRRLRAYHSVVSRYLMARSYLAMTGRAALAHYIDEALRDFSRGSFGRLIAPASWKRSHQAPGLSSKRDMLARCRRILVYAVGSYEHINGAIALASQMAPRASLAVAAAVERANMYKTEDVEEVLTFDLVRDGLIDKLKMAFRILRGRFSCGIIPDKDFTIPYAFLLPKNVCYDAESEELVYSPISRWHIWKIPVTVLVGAVRSLVALPFLLWKSSIYHYMKQ